MDLLNNHIELQSFINKRLKTDVNDRIEYGEVFTPLYLIDEMLDKLDEHYIKEHNKSIFSENIKYFDPASGIGNFIVCLYLRLIKHFDKKHILENMIYMSELNEKNILIIKQIFNFNDEFKLNLYQGNTLELDIKKEFNIDKFDVILGNPPYNSGGLRSCSQKNLRDKNETIWPKFVKFSMRCLKEDGYLVFINPLSWLRITHSVHSLLLDKNIIWMKLTDSSKSKEIIKAGIALSFYILQNKLNKGNKTTIVSEFKRYKIMTVSNVYLNKDCSIPLAHHTIFGKLATFIKKHNLKLEIKTKTVKTVGDKFNLPKVYSLEDNLAVATHTIKDGVQVKKTEFKHEHQNNRKIIIPNKSSFNGAFIDEGKLSLSGREGLYILGDSLELLLKLFNFKLLYIIVSCTRYNQDFLNTQAFTYIPDIRKLNIEDINENDFYKMLKLNKKEIDYLY